MIWENLGCYLKQIATEQIITIGQQNYFLNFFRRVFAYSSLIEGDDGLYCPSGKLLCLLQTPRNYAAHYWQHSIRVWLLLHSVCSSHSTKELYGLGVLLTFCIDIQINRQFVDPACLSRLLIGSSSKNGDLSTHNTRVPSLAPSHLHIFCYNWVPRTIVTKCLPTVMPSWAVFVAQLVERSLPIPDVRS